MATRAKQAEIIKAMEAPGGRQPARHLHLSKAHNRCGTSTCARSRVQNKVVSTLIKGLADPAAVAAGNRCRPAGRGRIATASMRSRPSGGASR